MRLFLSLAYLRLLPVFRSSEKELDVVRNKVQFQMGRRLNETFKHNGTEEHCYAALAQWRWQEEVQCPSCGHEQHSS